MTRTVYRWTTSGVILSALLSFAGIQPAHAQTKDFNVAAQSATTGIPEFARQAGIQILVSEPLVRGKRVAAVTGSHSVEEALAILLKGTGLAATSKDGATYTVTAGPRAPISRASSADEGQASGPSTVEIQDEQTSKKRPVQLDEVVVTGSRIPLAAGQQQVTPVRGYTREDIENSGQSTIGEFLNTLPDVSNFKPGSILLGLAGTQAVQLHGLPIGTTLTLLDGQRLPTNFYAFFDAGNIPVSAVERLEILPVGASAVYGADALAGAVNFILRKDIDGLDVNATLDHAASVNDPSVNLAWGKHWDRGSVSVIASYQDRGQLLGMQREPWSSTSVPANLPGSIISAIAGTSCAPGTVYSVDGVSNLPGLSSPYAAIPVGISGTPTIAQLAATAGKQNICSADRYVELRLSRSVGELCLRHTTWRLRPWSCFLRSCSRIGTCRIKLVRRYPCPSSLVRPSAQTIPTTRLVRMLTSPSHIRVAGNRQFCPLI